MKGLLPGLALAISMTGCVSTYRMDIDTFERLQPDCANKEAQIQFIESQMARESETTFAVIEMHTLLGMISAANDGTFKQKQALAERRYNSAARRMIWEIRTKCG